MPSWVEQAIRRGILTTRYPNQPATPVETPLTSRPPLPRPGTPIPPSAVAACPVGALSQTSVDRGRCIRCARCIPVGLEFAGAAEAATRTRGALVVPSGKPPVVTSTPGPLSSLGRSLHVFMVDVGSCNACNLEVLALANPYYDSQRLGIFFTNSPRHADVLVVVGVPTEEMVEPLWRAYEALPAPKAVLAVGVCPISGGVFAGTDGLRDSLGGILPVDVFVPGCPPTPLNVLDGLLELAGRGRRPREA